MKEETAKYVEIPTIIEFGGEEAMKQAIENNYKQVKTEIAELVKVEFLRVEAEKAEKQ